MAKDYLQRDIIIKQTGGANYLKLGKKYRVMGISSDGGLILHGLNCAWYGIENIHFELAIPENSEINIGDTVIVIKPTTSLEDGAERVVLDFLCDDKNKIVVEGVIPGGWLDATKVVKKINISKLRIKKVIEIIEERGLCFPNHIIFHEHMKSITGKNLSDLSTYQRGKNIYVGQYPKGKLLDSQFISDKEYEPIELRIASNPTNTSPIKRNASADGLLKILGKSLIELMNIKPEEEEQKLIGLVFEYINSGRIKVGEFFVGEGDIKVIKTKNNEKVEEVNDAIPF